MPPLKLTAPIKTPAGPQADFDLPEKATLGLFRGVELPVSVDGEKRTTVILKSDGVVLFIANLLQIPPSFAANIPLEQVQEILVGALPLLPPAWRGLIPTGNPTRAG